MITLTLLHPKQAVPVRSWTFEREPVIRVGRSTDNQVVLLSAVVSRHHLELRQQGDTWTIINLGVNGTYRNDKPITQISAEDGIVIRLARSGPQLRIDFSADPLHLPSKKGQFTPPISAVSPDSEDDLTDDKTLPSTSILPPEKLQLEGGGKTQTDSMRS